MMSLIRHGADVNAVAHDTPILLFGCRNDTDESIVQILVESGVDVNPPYIDGRTSLMYSVGSEDLCQFLIKRGALVNAVDDHGRTALHCAVRHCPSAFGTRFRHFRLQ